MSRLGTKVLLLFSLLLFFPRPGLAQDEERIEACFSAYEETQVHLKKKAYEKARELARSCSSGCPQEIVDQCQKWAWEAERDAPSVLLVARFDSGEDAPDVTVSVDGDWKPLQKEVLLDPGTHSIVFSRKDGWEYAIKIEVHPGEKRRTIRAAVPSEAEEDKPPPPVVEKKNNSHVPWAVASFSVSAVGFGLAGTFTAIALNRRDALEECAASGCDPADVDKAHAALRVADVGLAVGAIGLATGVGILLWGKPKPKKPQQGAASLSVGPARGGLSAFLSGSF